MNLWSEDAPLTPSLSPKGRGRRRARTSIGRFNGSMREFSGGFSPRLAGRRCGRKVAPGSRHASELAEPRALVRLVSLDLA